MTDTPRPGRTSEGVRSVLYGLSAFAMGLFVMYALLFIWDPPAPLPSSAAKGGSQHGTSQAPRLSDHVSPVPAAQERRPPPVEVWAEAPPPPAFSPARGEGFVPVPEDPHGVPDVATVESVPTEDIPVCSNCYETFLPTDEMIAERRFTDGRRMADREGAQAAILLLLAMQTTPNPDYALMAGVGTGLAAMIDNVSSLPIVAAALQGTVPTGDSCHQWDPVVSDRRPPRVGMESATLDSPQTRAGTVADLALPTTPAAPDAEQARPAEHSGEGDLTSIGHDTFWLRLGEPGAPAVWMLADPACPHCADALDRLSSALIGGQLQIRLALAPFLSDRSWDLAADIILAPDPAQRAWDQMRAKAAGQPPDVAPGTAEAIKPLGSALLDANLDWMRDHGISAVPHFVWRDGNGNWHQASGVQAITTFAQAVPGADATAEHLGMHAPESVLARIDVDAVTREIRQQTGAEEGPTTPAPETGNP